MHVWIEDAFTAYQIAFVIVSSVPYALLANSSNSGEKIIPLPATARVARNFRASKVECALDGWLLP
jgi:hypothetical protein